MKIGDKVKLGFGITAVVLGREEERLPKLAWLEDDDKVHVALCEEYTEGWWPIHGTAGLDYADLEYIAGLLDTIEF